MAALTHDRVIISGHAYGIGVRFDVAATCQLAVRAALPPGWVGGDVDDTAVTWAIDAAEHVQLAVGTAELYIAEHAPNLVFIHAGAVTVDGRAIVIPGRTMTGKTTLVHALVKAGATYYSDEYAILDRSGRVRPYPRPLQMRTDGGVVPVDANTIGTVGDEPAPVALIAHLRRDKAWDVAELTPSRRVLALLDNAVAAQSRTIEVLARCGTVAEHAAGYTGTRGDAEHAAATLIDMVRG